MRADFYLLNNSHPQAGWLVACRLLEKAYLRNHRVFVYCETRLDAMMLDELLWTFKDDSFIPHNLQGEGPEPPPAVQIGHDTEPRGFSDILMNMSTKIPPFHTRFQRIMEIVMDNDAAKAIGRQHYKEYRARGFDMHTHPID
jgi:DNA polymerase-3 subunit chi